MNVEGLIVWTLTCPSALQRRGRGCRVSSVVRGSCGGGEPVPRPDGGRDRRGLIAGSGAIRSHHVMCGDGGGVDITQGPPNSFITIVQPIMLNVCLNSRKAHAFPRIYQKIFARYKYPRYFPHRILEVKKLTFEPRILVR